MPQAAQAAILPALATPFEIKAIDLPMPVGDEVLVQVAGCGICHTDIKVSRGYANVPVPVILGHEGAGIVLETGPECDTLQPGDHVVMSFPSCGQCQQCVSHHPAYCDTGQHLSFSCQHSGNPYKSSNGDMVYGAFFGQSSFASHALVSARNAVKVDQDLPLELLGPLGCGFQTGAGAVLNVLQPAPGEAMVIFGAGNVGLSAVMAAVIAGLDPIITLDIHAGRLVLARQLGATHVIDLSEEKSPVDAIHRLTAGRGAQYSLDTTNQPQVVRQAFECLANRGTCIHSGGGGKDLCFPGSHLLHGRTITGVIQGDSDPQAFIPKLLDYYRAGKFPFERLLSIYPLAQINRAVEEMEAGGVIKPVLMMP